MLSPITVYLVGVIVAAIQTKWLNGKIYEKIHPFLMLASWPAVFILSIIVLLEVVDGTIDFSPIGRFFTRINSSKLFKRVCSFFNYP